MKWALINCVFFCFRLNEIYMFSKRIFHWWNARSSALLLFFHWMTQSNSLRNSVLSLFTSGFLSSSLKKVTMLPTKLLSYFERRSILFTHFDNRQHMKFLNNSIFYANETQRNCVSESLLSLARDIFFARLVFVCVVLIALNRVKIWNGIFFLVPYSGGE